MRRRLAILTLLLLSTGMLSAQEEGAETPFSLNVGPQENGGLGAVLKGDRFFSPDGWRKDFSNGRFAAPYVGLLTEATWNSEPGTTDNAALSLQSGLMFGHFNSNAFLPAAPVLDVYFDVRQRFGEFKAADGQVDEVNQRLLGVGAMLQVPYGFKLINATRRWRPARSADVLDPLPYISITYYDAQDVSSRPQQLPPSIEASKIVTRLKGQFTVPKIGVTAGESTWPFRLQYDLSVTKPTSGDDTEWQDLVDLALVLDTGTAMNVAARYVHGKEESFTYDRQLLLGLIWRLGAQ